MPPVKRSSLLIISSIIWLAIFSLPSLVLAVGITAEHKTSRSMVSGTLVSVIADQAETVEPSNLENAGRVYGVAVDFEQSRIALGGHSNETVQVARDGVIDVLVSDLGGEINRGDHLTVSALSGTAQKAATEPISIGVALGEFKGEDDKTLGTTEVTTSQGETIQVRISKISVQFAIGANPDAHMGAGRIPGFLQDIGEAAAGKPVSAVRVIGAFLVLLVTLIISGVLLLGSIRSAMISIGRNPLSRRGVYKGMAQVFGLVALVLIAGLGTIYLIIRI